MSQADSPTVELAPVLKGGLRRKYVLISPELLFYMFMEGNVIRSTIMQGFPPESKLVKSGYCDFGQPYQPGSFYLVVEHESFPELQEGTIYPPENIVIRRDA